MVTSYEDLVQENLQGVRESSFTNLYNFFYRYLKESDVKNVKKLEDAMIEAFGNTFIEHYARFYGAVIDVSQTGHLVEPEITRMTNEMEGWLKEQIKKSRAEVRRTAPAGTTKTELEKRYELVRGLPSTQVRSLMLYRNQLQRENRRSTAIDRLTEREAARRRRLRATQIARTESVRWVGVAQRVALRAAIQQGILPESASFIWVTSKKDNVCKVCKDMSKQMVSVDQNFVMPDGRHIAAPPIHPSCHCVLALLR